MGEAHPSRRAVLATAGALALAGCLPSTDEPTPAPDPDLRLRTRVAAEVRVLVAAYAAATAAHPALTDRLAPLAAEHSAHVRALLPPAASASSSVPATPTASTSSTAVPPGGADATVGWLAGLELRAARRRTRQAGAAGPDLARLLASVAACDAVHVALLGGRS